MPDAATIQLEARVRSLEERFDAWEKEILELYAEEDEDGLEIAHRQFVAERKIKRYGNA